MTAGGRRIDIRGVVQGVGFRPWVYRLAQERGIAGRVRNGTDGVTIEAFGSDAALESFLGSLRASPPPAAVIRDLSWRPIPPLGILSARSLPGGVAEWSKAAVLKTAVLARVPGVRIPSPPPRVLAELLADFRGLS